MIGTILSFVGVSTAVSVLLASSQAPSIVQPEVYLDPSGRLELAVDPRERSGRSGADLRLTRDGALVWERACDVAFADVRLFEDGSVAGYAYPGALVLLFLAPDGTERARTELRRSSAAIHAPLKPNVTGLELVSDPDCVTFRLDSGHARHFTREGVELDAAPVGKPTEPWLVRKPIVFLPPPERSLELVELARVALQYTPIEPSTRKPLPRVATRTGTLALVEWNGALHVFGADGRRAVLCVPDESDGVRYRPYEFLDVDSDGRLHAFNDGTHLRFEADGRRSAALARDKRRPELELISPGGGIWRIDPDRVVLRREGRDDFVVRSSAANHWFQFLRTASVAPDSVLAVLDDTSDLEQPGGAGCAIPRGAETALQLFEPDGRPRATFPVSTKGLGSSLQLVARAGEVAVFDETELELVVFASDGSRSGRARLPQAFAPSSTFPGPITYSPDGRELWLLDYDLTLYRFELRWK